MENILVKQNHFQLHNQILPCRLLVSDTFLFHCTLSEDKLVPFIVLKLVYARDLNLSSFICRNLIFIKPRHNWSS